MLSGCATFVSGERADLGKGGYEYSLPVPIIVVTPQANGTLDVKVDYLPDPNNTYVLRTESLISSYTLDVKRTNGMLTSVSLDAKADGVAEAIAESAGNVVKAKGDVLAKEKEKAEIAEKEQLKAIDQAELSLAIAVAKQKTIIAAKETSKFLDAELAVAEAQAKLDHLSKRVASGGASYNDPGDGTLPTAAGPVIFRVVTEADGVKLVALDGPSSFVTSLAAKPGTKVEDLTAEVQGSSVLKRDRDKPLQFVILVNKPVASVDLDNSLLQVAGSNEDARKWLVAANANNTSTGALVIVTLKNNMPKGTYLFTPVFKKNTGEPMQTDPVKITVAP